MASDNLKERASYRDGSLHALTPNEDPELADDASSSDLDDPANDEHWEALRNKALKKHEETTRMIQQLEQSQRDEEQARANTEQLEAECASVHRKKLQTLGTLHQDQAMKALDIEAFKGNFVKDHLMMKMVVPILNANKMSRPPIVEACVTFLVLYFTHPVGMTASGKQQEGMTANGWNHKMVPWNKRNASGFMQKNRKLMDQLMRYLSRCLQKARMLHEHEDALMDKDEYFTAVRAFFGKYANKNEWHVQKLEQRGVQLRLEGFFLRVLE